jgi:hypothetical protein
MQRDEKKHMQSLVAYAQKHMQSLVEDDWKQMQSLEAHAASDSRISTHV